jgi:hypothetical protein
MEMLFTTNVALVRRHLAVAYRRGLTVPKAEEDR